MTWRQGRVGNGPWPLLAERCSAMQGPNSAIFKGFDFQPSLDIVQGSTLLCVPGLVKFVPAVARLFFLALPGSLLCVLCTL